MGMKWFKAMFGIRDDDPAELKKQYRELKAKAAERRYQLANLPELANQLVETVMGGAGASSSVALGRAGTKAELGKIDSVAQNSLR